MDDISKEDETIVTDDCSGKKIFLMKQNCFNNDINGSQKLTVLKLNNLSLTHLPDDNISNLFNLYEINLSDNKLIDLPKNLLGAKNLRILNLANNKFTKLPKCLLNGLCALKYLNLSNNLLNRFDEPPACLPLLRELILSYNFIEILPDWLLNDYQFMFNKLDLSFNPCFKIYRDYQVPSKNRMCGQIRKLILQNTNFTITSFGLLLYFPTIVSLDLSNCKNIGNKVVNKVGVGYNMFCELKINYLPITLVELQLQNINLATFPNLFNLKQLKSLNISTNTFYWLPPDESLPNCIQSIDLNSTKLIIIPDYIGNLTCLTRLLLADNDLSSLPQNFKLLKNLELLDLYNNSFQIFPDLKTFTKLQAFDFSMNYCEPNLKPLGEENITYEELKNNLRNQLNCETRQDVVKIFKDDSETEFVSNFSTSSEGSFSTINEEDQMNNLLLKNQYSVDEEIWNFDNNNDDNDDYFDPTILQNDEEINVKIIKDMEIFGENCLKYCPKEIVNSPHLYLPYAERSNTYFYYQYRSRFIKYRSEEDIESNVIVDGQFDDA